MSKAEDLKALNEESRELNEKKKALRDELNKGKAERSKAKSEQARCRKITRELKAQLRDHSAKIYSTFSDGDVEAIDELADDIMETASALAASIRNFGKAASSLDEL